MEADPDEDGDEEGAGGAYGEEDDMDDEEFLQMMEAEAAQGRLGLAGVRGAPIGEQDSTIINSSQNTSLEDNFLGDAQ